MRLWSIHPKYLDHKGLVAVWREGLLARKVLEGKTVGYTRHPQLERFRGHERPIAAIDTYLKCVFEESVRRGYSFNREKIGDTFTQKKMRVTRGQVEFELGHLKSKLKVRNNVKYKELLKVKDIQTNPVFSVRGGLVEDWEKNEV